MYSGRITETGTVIEAGSRLVIGAPKTAAGLSPGGSVSINGTCLSAVQADGAAGRFSAEVSAETAKRSTLGELAPDARVNLELPLRVGDALDGHLVQGHTDAIGKVTKVEAEHGGSLRVWIRPPKRFLEEIVAKGSVAVDGVSLTVADIAADRFSVALIPLTLAETTLAALARRPGRAGRSYRGVAGAVRGGRPARGGGHLRGHGTRRAHADGGRGGALRAGVVRSAGLDQPAGGASVTETCGWHGQRAARPAGRDRSSFWVTMTTQTDERSGSA
jgi:3,4-dihydroxy 2-butanone 4-phosphate synthase